MSATLRAYALHVDLVRFLLTRVEEDEATLKKLLKHGASDDAAVRSIARLQADAVAKRRVIGTLQHLLVLRDQPFEKTIRDQATSMLRALAVPYEAHPGYRAEWRLNAPY